LLGFSVVVVVTNVDMSIRIDPVPLYEECSHIQRVLITAPRKTGKTRFLSYYQLRKEDTTLKIGIFFQREEQVEKFKYDYRLSDNVTVGRMTSFLDVTPFDIVLFDEILSSEAMLLNKIRLRNDTIIACTSTLNVMDNNHTDNLVLLLKNGFTVVNK
jgi:hypothetical protein